MLHHIIIWLSLYPSNMVAVDSKAHCASFYRFLQIKLQRNQTQLTRNNLLCSIWNILFCLLIVFPHIIKKQNALDSPSDEKSHFRMLCLNVLYLNFLWCIIIILRVNCWSWNKIHNRFWVIRLRKRQLQCLKLTRPTLWKMGHNGINDVLSSVNPALVYMARRGKGEQVGLSKGSSWMNKLGKNICIMTYLLHILSQMWISIHVVTPAASVQCVHLQLCVRMSQENGLGNFRDERKADRSK